MFGNWGGFGTVKKMASAIGIDYKLYGTALTSMGVNYAHFKTAHKQAIQSGDSEDEVLVKLATSSIPSALAGLDKLTMKFPGESSIYEAKVSLAEFAFCNNLISEADVEVLRNTVHG